MSKSGNVRESAAQNAADLFEMFETAPDEFIYPEGHPQAGTIRPGLVIESDNAYGAGNQSVVFCLVLMALVLDLDIVMLTSHAAGCPCRTVVERANGAQSKRLNGEIFKLGCDTTYVTKEVRDAAVDYSKNKIFSKVD